MSAVTPLPTAGDDPQEEELVTVRVPPAVLLQVKDGARVQVQQHVQPAPPADDSSQKMMELRGWLMVLATVIASITYASGLSPPGGFERASRPRVTATMPPPRSGGIINGTTVVDSMMPALREASPGRFRAFYYCNTAAFALSLSIMLLLASRDLRKLARTKALEILVGLDVLALLVAYIAGSTFGVMELAVCSGLVLIVPLALVVVSSSRLGGKYFWDEVSSE